MGIGQGGRSAWPSNDDLTFLSLAVIVIGLAFFSWLGWTEYHGLISSVVARVALWEIRVLHFFTPALDGLARQISAANFERVTVAEILSVLNLIGTYFRIPAIAFILVLAVACFVRAAPSQFTRILDLDGLIAQQAEYYTSIAPFVRRRLRLSALPKGEPRPADPALNPREWVDRYANPREDGTFEEAAAAAAFKAQLGPVWRGPAKAPGQHRLLFAVFALHLAQRRVEAKALLAAFAEVLPPGDEADATGPAQPFAMPLAVVQAADTKLHSMDLRDAEQIASRHAYATPVLMSLLTAARRSSGVLAPSQFLALKLVDRHLWYALHSLGFEGDGPGQMNHPNPRVEAAGARAHWDCERVAGRPLLNPALSRAIDAVRTALGQDAVPFRHPEDS